MSDRPGPRDQSEQRATVRREARAARRSLDPGLRRRFSDDICAHIIANDRWLAATLITIYVPMEPEVDVWPLLVIARESGKRVAIPRIVDREHGIMTFDRLGTDSSTRADELVIGEFGIPRAREADEVHRGDVDLVLVPATAVDTNGNRLGGGAGYYDRWLAGARASDRRLAGARAEPFPRPFALGVVFGVQVMAAGTFAVEAHDQPLDAWVTEHGISRNHSITP